MSSAPQLSLLDEQTGGLPDGFEYRPGLVSPEDEVGVVEALRALNFRPFEFHGYLGNRRPVSFGWHYDFASSRVRPASDIPDFLLLLRDRAVVFARVPPDP